MGSFHSSIDNLTRRVHLCDFGRLVNLNIKFIAQAQRRYFAREDEILDQNPKGSPKEYELRTFIPPSLTESEYWRYVAIKCFAVSTHLGSSIFFLTFTMNPLWPDHKALMRGDGLFADSAIALIIFMIKLSALMNFIQKCQILDKVSAFVSRIEHQKEVFHMLISSFRLISMPKTLMPLMQWSIPDIQKILLF
jgi:hypothetical protein